jgi:uncharacterized protein YkwD
MEHSTISGLAVFARRRFGGIRVLIAGALLILPLLFGQAAKAARPLPQSSSTDVITLINTLRTEKGLPAYRIHPALMSAAQAHSEWMAANSRVSHTGADGSRPISRAAAAGYGSGTEIIVAESLASGTYMNPTNAVQVWQNDSVDLNTMLSRLFTEAGAGIASDGKTTYITLVVGSVSAPAGETDQGGNAAQTPGAATATSSAIPTTSSGKFELRPVMTVTPQADGSILHIVQPGEVLLNIALAYGVQLSDLYRLNNLNEKSVIYPGEKVKIKAADPTSTPTETPTLTPIPTATRRPTRTPTPTTIIVPETTPMAATPYADAVQAESGPDILLIAIGALLVLGIGLVVIGSLLRK